MEWVGVIPIEWRRGYGPVSPPWGVSENLKRALTREVVIPPLEEVLPVERDKDNIEMEVAKVIYETHLRKDGVIWDNLLPDVRDWVLEQAKAVLKYLESTGILELEEQRLR